MIIFIKSLIIIFFTTLLSIHETTVTKSVPIPLWSWGVLLYKFIVGSPVLLCLNNSKVMFLLSVEEFFMTLCSLLHYQQPSPMQFSLICFPVKQRVTSLLFKQQKH